MTALRRVQDSTRPTRLRQLPQSTQDGRAATADGHEVDASLVDARQFQGVDHLAVKVEPSGVGTGDFVPESHEPHQFAMLIGAVGKY